MISIYFLTDLLQTLSPRFFISVPSYNVNEYQLVSVFLKLDIGYYINRHTHLAAGYRYLYSMSLERLSVA